MDWKKAKELMYPNETPKRDYTKFFTPEPIANYMAELLNPVEDGFYLEPHAGYGALAAAVLRRSPHSIMCLVEKNPDMEPVLRLIGKIVVIKDFLELQSIPKFSGCIANPPFGNGIDLHGHFWKIMYHVSRGGTIVMLLPKDFNIPFPHETFDCENWSKNSDGTTTEIKIVRFVKH